MTHVVPDPQEPNKVEDHEIRRKEAGMLSRKYYRYTKYMAQKGVCLDYAHRFPFLASIILLGNA